MEVDGEREKEAGYGTMGLIRNEFLFKSRLGFLMCRQKGLRRRCVDKLVRGIPLNRLSYTFVESPKLMIQTKMAQICIKAYHMRHSRSTEHGICPSQ